MSRDLLIGEVAVRAKGGPSTLEPTSNRHGNLVGSLSTGRRRLEARDGARPLEVVVDVQVDMGKDI